MDVLVDTAFTWERLNLYLPLHLPTSFYKYLQAPETLSLLPAPAPDQPERFAGNRRPPDEEDVEWIDSAAGPPRSGGAQVQRGRAGAEGHRGQVSLAATGCPVGPRCSES